MLGRPLFKARRRAISLTALIDVVFILLLFFMLTSTFTPWRSLDFSVASSAQGEVSTPPQVIELMPDGALFERHSGWQVQGVGALLPADLARFDPAQTVYLSPHEEVDLQLIVKALEALKAIGLPAVSLGPVIAGGRA